jgi:hypothetical protein
MSYHDDAITDQLPFARFEVPWTAEDLFPIPPSVQLFDSSTNQAVPFKVIGRTSKGSHQFALIHNAQIDVAAIVELDEDGSVEIMRDNDKAMEVEQEVYRADNERDTFGGYVRHKYEPVIVDEEGQDYRIQLGGTLNYKGGVYQVMAPADDKGEQLMICRLQYDKFGCEDTLTPVTDEQAIRDLYKQFFKMLDDQREQAHGEKTYGAFEDKDEDLFS